MPPKIKSLLYLICFVASAIVYEVTLTSEDSVISEETAKLVEADTKVYVHEVNPLEDIKK